MYVASDVDFDEDLVSNSLGWTISNSISSMDVLMSLNFVVDSYNVTLVKNVFGYFDIKAKDWCQWVITWVFMVRFGIIDQYLSSRCLTSWNRSRLSCVFEVDRCSHQWFWNEQRIIERWFLRLRVEILISKCRCYFVDWYRLRSEIDLGMISKA